MLSTEVAEGQQWSVLPSIEEAVQKVTQKVIDCIEAARIAIEVPFLPKSENATESYKHHSQHSVDISQLKEEGRRRRRRIQEALKKEALREEEQQREQQRQLREEQAQARESKRKAIQERLAEIKEREKSRLQQFLQANKKFKEVKGKRPLHKELEQRYVSQYLLPEISMRKQRLLQLKSRVSELGLSEIKQHQRKYMEFKQASEGRNPQLPVSSYEPAVGSVHFHKLLEEEEEARKNQQLFKQMEAEQKRKKKEEYVQYLRQNFAPKRQERTVSLAVQEKKTEKVALAEEERRRKGDEYLRQAKNRSRKKAVSEEPREESARPAVQDYMQHLGQRELHKIREKRIDRIKNMPSQLKDRMELLRAEEQQLSRRFQEKNRLLQESADPALREEVNELLILSVKAKTSLLALASSRV